MKTFTEILFFTVFLSYLSPPVLTQSQAQSIPSVNNWRYGIDLASLPDYSKIKSFFYVDHNSQVFANYGWTRNDGTIGSPYWDFQTTWIKDFSAFTTPDTVYLDCKFLSGVNREKIIAINDFIAIQNPNHYVFDGKFTEHNNISLNLTWKTLSWDMKWAKDFGMNFFTKFYIAIQIATTDSCYTGAEIVVDNLRGFYNDSQKTIVYDTFGDITSVPRGNFVPTDFILYQNYPNPFNPATTIRYSVPIESGPITLKVYDLLGREVAQLVNEYKIAGDYEVQFNASNLPSGIYMYRFQSGSFSVSKKMMLMK